jgi:squalene-associated FAD-dependent desaturase
VAKPRTTKSTAIIGAGWAGCAAAVELAARGHKVVLFESARVLGGRARCVEHGGMRLDNGQQILLGAYSETLRLMKMVGVDQKKVLLRLPLQIRHPADSGGMDFIAARLPAPLHLLVALLRARGLSRDDKLALARFSTTARWMGWKLNTDCTVAELLERFDQTARLTHLMWRPLCIAALNTPPERASAQVFLNVLRDSLGARRAASDMLIPRVDLTKLFPHAAETYLRRHGGIVATGTTVKSLRSEGNCWRVETARTDTSGDGHLFDGVVVATQAGHAAALLEELLPGAIPSFEYEPITTCYLQYSSDTRLPLPFLALQGNAVDHHWGQFVFDRGQLDAKQAGLLAVVVSASHEAIALGHQALVAAVAAQLANVFKSPQLAKPLSSQVITEKRATFSCTPGLARPENATTLPGLVLAGDYTAGDYPATLEGAVRSAVKAAKLLAA